MFVRTPTRAPGHSGRLAAPPTRRGPCGWAPRLLLALSLVCWSGLASALPATDFSYFGPDAVSLDFDEITMSAGTVVTDQYAGFGVRFTPNVWFEDNRAPLGWDSNNIANFLTGTSISNPSIDIVFSSVVDAAAFEFAGNAGNDFLFEALLGGSVVESFVHAQTGCCTAQVLGFQAVEFDTLRVSHQSGGSTFLIADNLTFQVVPEPGTALLMGLGLALLPLAGGGRRAATQRASCERIRAAKDAPAVS